MSKKALLDKLYLAKNKEYLEVEAVVLENGERVIVEKLDREVIEGAVYLSNLMVTHPRNVTEMKEGSNINSNIVGLKKSRNEIYNELPSDQIKVKKITKINRKQNVKYESLGFYM